MRFLTFVLKNVGRRPLRSSLTVFAVAIAVGAVVALVGISSQFEHSFLRLYENAGIDLVVVRAGLRQRLTSTLDQNLRLEIEKIPGVKAAIPALIDVVSFADDRMYGVVVQGCSHEVLPYFRLVSGRYFSPQDGKAVLLGKILAANLGKAEGDEIELYEGEHFKVLGVFESQ